mmetsp:Transcript_4230/g.15834  ORF Transcript_4230/g.15834 Transcript_4230/m.15834 type:complete len:1282 (-) Transcript_4230:310-4155(-)
MAITLAPGFDISDSAAFYRDLADELAGIARQTAEINWSSDVRVRLRGRGNQRLASHGLPPHRSSSRAAGGGKDAFGESPGATRRPQAGAPASARPLSSSAVTTARASSASLAAAGRRGRRPEPPYVPPAATPSTVVPSSLWPGAPPPVEVSKSKPLHLAEAKTKIVVVSGRRGAQPRSQGGSAFAAGENGPRARHLRVGPGAAAAAPSAAPSRVPFASSAARFPGERASAERPLAERRASGERPAPSPAPAWNVADACVQVDTCDIGVGVAVQASPPATECSRSSSVADGDAIDISAGAGAGSAGVVAAAAGTVGRNEAAAVPAQEPLSARSGASSGRSEAAAGPAAALALAPSGAPVLRARLAGVVDLQLLLPPPPPSTPNPSPQWPLHAGVPAGEVAPTWAAAPSMGGRTAAAWPVSAHEGEGALGGTLAPWPAPNVAPGAATSAVLPYGAPGPVRPMLKFLMHDVLDEMSVPEYELADVTGGVELGLLGAKSRLPKRAGVRKLDQDAHWQSIGTLPPPYVDSRPPRYVAPTAPEATSREKERSRGDAESAVVQSLLTGLTETMAQTQQQAAAQVQALRDAQAHFQEQAQALATAQQMVVAQREESLQLARSIQQHADDAQSRLQAAAQQQSAALQQEASTLQRQFVDDALRALREATAPGTSHTSQASVTMERPSGPAPDIGGASALLDGVRRLESQLEIQRAQQGEERASQLATVTAALQQHQQQQMLWQQLQQHQAQEQHQQDEQRRSQELEFRRVREEQERHRRQEHEDRRLQQQQERQQRQLQQQQQQQLRPIQVLPLSMPKASPTQPKPPAVKKSDVAAQADIGPNHQAKVSRFADYLLHGPPGTAQPSQEALGDAQHRWPMLPETAAALAALLRQPPRRRPSSPDASSSASILSSAFGGGTAALSVGEVPPERRSISSWGRGAPLPGMGAAGAASSVASAGEVSLGEVSGRLSEASFGQVRRAAAPRYGRMTSEPGELEVFASSGEVSSSSGTWPFAFARPLPLSGLEPGELVDGEGPEDLSLGEVPLGTGSSEGEAGGGAGGAAVEEDAAGSTCSEGQIVAATPAVAPVGIGGGGGGGGGPCGGAACQEGEVDAAHDLQVPGEQGSGGAPDGKRGAHGPRCEWILLRDGGRGLLPRHEQSLRERQRQRPGRDGCRDEVCDHHRLRVRRLCGGPWPGAAIHCHHALQVRQRADRGGGGEREAAAAGNRLPHTRRQHGLGLWARGRPSGARARLRPVHREGCRKAGWPDDRIHRSTLVPEVGRAHQRGEIRSA